MKIKKSYPNDSYKSAPGSYDVNGWLNAIKNIYYLENNNLNRIQAFNEVTKDWTETEKKDFNSWIKFYEEGSHMKYKKAQWLNNTTPSFFYPLEQKKDEQPIKMIDDKSDKEDRKFIIENQRKKIVSRLDSVEKLLRTNDAHIFAGKELESLIEAIYSLKKKIQLLNKVSSSNKTYEDLIIREANVLTRNNFYKAADYLSALAQQMPQPPKPAAPIDSSGEVGGLPSMGPGMPQLGPGEMENGANIPDSVVDAPAANEDEPTAVQSFLSRMENGTATEDDSDTDDILEVDDILNVEDFISTAQEVPLPQTKPLAVNKPVPSKPVSNNIEVTEEDLKTTPEPSKIIETSNFDVDMDRVLSQITVADVVKKLEELSKIFKVREIPRQLAIVDMMLDSLKLSSYFDNLSEAINKAQESNNYINTRVDDILSKLRGAMDSKHLDLIGNDQIRDDIEPLKNKLQNDQEKEKQRKEQRKAKENEKTDLEVVDEEQPIEVESPNVELSNDLSKPIAPATLPQTK